MYSSNSLQNLRCFFFILPLSAICLVVFFSLYHRDSDGSYNEAVLILSANVTDPPATTKQTFCGYFVRGEPDGRLGNRMFFYASFYGLARTVGQISGKLPFVRVRNIPSPINNIFTLSLTHKTVPNEWMSAQNFTTLNENGKCCALIMGNLNNMACDGKSIYLGGYRQSYKYFENVSKEIRQEFQFKTDIKEKCQRYFYNTLLDNNVSKDCVTIAAHMRRGDFSSKGKMGFGHSPATVEYLQRAVNFFEARLLISNNTKAPTCTAVLLFGDDYNWNVNASQTVRLSRPQSTRFIVMNDKRSEPALDMCVMTLCNHTIMSSGTFGWWAAYLTNGQVTYNSRYAMPNTSHYKEYVPEDFFPPHWIAL